jgi:hypothetical protein
MFRHLVLCATSIGTLAAALLFVSGVSQAAAAQSASSDCDRACLRQALDTYMAAIFKHDAGAARLSDDHYATENTAEVKSGEGFWKEFSGYGEVQRRYFDPLNESAAFLGLLKQDGQDKIVSVRIKVDGGKVSEAEWIVTHEGNGRVPHPEGLIKDPPPDGVLPASQRTSRFLLKSIAGGFYQGVSDHYGKWIPTEPTCYNVEMGTRGKSTGCPNNFEGMAQRTKDIELRSYPVVDEEAGIVLSDVIFVRFPGVANQDNLVHEYIWIRSGKLAGWFTSMHFLPMGSPVTNGWENRKGRIIK